MMYVLNEVMKVNPETTSHLASPVTMNLRKTVKKTKTADECMLETAGWVG